MENNMYNIDLNFSFFSKKVMEKVKEVKPKTEKKLHHISLNFNLFLQKTLNTINELKQNNKLNENSIEYKILKYQQGDESMFDEIFNEYKSKLERVSIRKGNKELFGELIEALWSAVKTFKIEYGVKFNTYYWKCANNHLGILNIRKNAKKRQANNNIISLSKIINNSDNETNIENFIEDKNSNNEFNNSLFNIFLEKNIFPKISDSEIKTINLILEGYTLEEIGKKLGGLTAAAIHVKLRRLAKKPCVRKQLKELYNYIS